MSLIRKHLVITLGVTAWISGWTVSGVVPAKQATVDPQVRTPISVVKEAAIRLNEQDLAWQFYSEYSDYFYSYARQYASVRVRTKAQLALQREWVYYFTSLGDLVVKMQDIKKEKDNIRKNKTTLPYGQRQQYYKTAAIKHRQLLDELVARAKQAPKQKLSLTQDSGSESRTTGP